MKKFLIKNKRKIIVVAILTTLISIFILSKEWVVNLVWMNAAVIGRIFQEQGPHKLLAFLIVCLLIFIVWNLWWKIYTLVAYGFREYSGKIFFFL